MRPLVLLLFATPVFAGPVRDVATEVLAAHKTADIDALKSLAEKDDPDPWHVAHELCARGEHDAAEAFARAAPRKDVEKLPEYVASRRGKPNDPATLAALAAAREAQLAGDWTGMLAACESVAPTDDGVAAVRLASGRATALHWLSRGDETLEPLLEAGTRAEGLGWLRRATQIFVAAGDMAHTRSDFRRALGAFNRSLEIDRARGDRAGTARNLGKIGAILMTLGDLHAALRHSERALALFEELNDAKGAALAERDVAGALGLLGNWPEALKRYERALRLMQDTGDRTQAAEIVACIGLAHDSMGDYTKALGHYERALKLAEELGDRIGIAGVLECLGNMYSSLGEYAKALKSYERALELAEGLERPLVAGSILANLGRLHHSLGHYDKALELHGRALAVAEALDAPGLIAGHLINIGNVHISRGDHRGALDYELRALSIAERLGDRRMVALALYNIGLVHYWLWEYPKALEYYNQALRLCEESRDGVSLANTLVSIGLLHERLGDYARALECQERALAEAERLGARSHRVYALWGLARTHLSLGKPAVTVARSRQAFAVLGEMSSGLSESEGAALRERFEEALEVAVRGAVQLGNPGELSFLLESSRARMLLESFGGRRRMQGIVLPAELQKAEIRAHASEAAALATYRSALNEGGDAESRWRDLEGARGHLVEVAQRVQREAKAQSGVLYPQAAPLDRIQATLGPDEAFVNYALLPEDALALVVTRDAARIVPLGQRKTIAMAAAALHSAVLRPDERGVAVPPHERLDFVAKRLRALVVEPLGLKGTKRLLVAPHAELAYVPFALLAPEVEVAYVPSGTTYELLFQDAALRGEGVLALGDPPAGDAQAATVYRGGEELAPLPASRAEAQAIGDVVLVGKDATEGGFVKAVASRPRWRAVHFACHGLVRADLPELSCLALGADAENDGFLTVLEVFRLKIPSDLVVLSACETAKGKVYRAEGVIGLARAFMLAGSPRVICSLWKVDDAATRELMTTFYKEWKSGVGAAEALRKAQQHVASQEKWKDPYFWAAWQLWGLPE